MFTAGSTRRTVLSSTRARRVSGLVEAAMFADIVCRLSREGIRYDDGLVVEVGQRFKGRAGDNVTPYAITAHDVWQ